MYVPLNIRFQRFLMKKMIAMNFRMMASRNQLEYPFQRKKFQNKEYRTKWKATTEFLNITVPTKEISVRYRVE